MNKICKYCEIFRTSPLFRGEKDIQRRCRIINKLVRIDSKACKHFIATSKFFCEKNSEWIDIKVCLNRRKNNVNWSKRIGCKNCCQFTKEIIFHYPQKSKRKLKRR